MLKKHIKKYLLSSAVVLSVASLVQGQTASATTYLETDKNYYTETGVSRGFLDQEISAATIGQDNWDKFQVAVTQNLVTYTPGMTFNEYYRANNIAIEDNFQVYRGGGVAGSQDVKLPSGAFLNSNPGSSGLDYITYVGPSDDRGAYWGDKELEDPVLFSRLTVGSPAFGVFSGSTWKFPTQIGYGEVATVNDYMLTADNGFVIPARFNSKRNDTYLTMRSRGLFGAGLTGAQVYLSATSNGQNVQGSGQNQKFYIDTKTNIFMTEKAYDQLGTRSKLAVALGHSAVNAQLQNVPVNEFAATMNANLQRAQNMSGANTIVSGTGGQIQLTGFYRQSDKDTVFTASEAERMADAVNNVDVTYYVYTNGSDPGVTVTTPVAGNGKHLYSPNESVFKIETTRPYFGNFGNLADEFTMTTAEAATNFDQSFGTNSFTVTDNGVNIQGDAVGVDESRVRVRVSTDNGVSYTAQAYTLAELKAAFENKTLPEGKLVLAYTYAAKDASDEILGKLPTEIADNKGAYAVPFTRIVNLTHTPDVATDLYIGINKSGNKALRTTDGKAIFVFGNSYEKGTNRNYNEFDLEYTVYTNVDLTDIVTVNTPVTWSVEAIAGFENSPAVVAKAQEMFQYKTGDTSTYTVGQPNYNHARALKSGVYKVTATLANGRSDHAYIVVPGDTDRSGILAGRDAGLIDRYIATGNVGVFPQLDQFTLYLADVDGNDIVQSRDSRLVRQMVSGSITSN